jgi:hypothetical protein
MVDIYDGRPTIALARRKPMRNQTTEKRTDEMRYGTDVELSERELLSIGKIVALWGSLEYEIFCQTLLSFNAPSANKLPKEMNNIQFSGVLALWENQVVNNATGKRKKVLQAQCKSIRHYKNFRDAIVHGMWDWTKAAPEKITATRIRKKEILRVHFTANDLNSFASELSTINFKIRYPGGPKQYSTAMAERGSHVSRVGLCLITNNHLNDDIFPSSSREGGEKV